jgi:hypothetical protein
VIAVTPSLNMAIQNYGRSEIDLAAEDAQQDRCLAFAAGVDGATEAEALIMLGPSWQARPRGLCI